MPGGRPTKLSPDVQQAIVRSVERGNYVEVAAALAGVSKETLYAWLRRGAREDTGSFREFSDAVKVAMAKAEADDLARIGAAAESGAWTAAAWRLERRAPGRWGRRVRVEVEQQLVRVMTVLRDRLPSESYDAVLVALAGMADQPTAYPDAGEPFEEESVAEPAPALGAGEAVVELE
jgi:transposase-like protein